MNLRYLGLLSLVVVAIGCGSTRSIVRVDPGPGTTTLHIPRTAEVQPVLVEKEEFQQALQQLAREVQLTGTPRETAERTFQFDPLSGSYLYLPRDKKLVPMGPGEPLEGTLTKEDLETAEHYKRWCQRVHDFYGDCLGGALVGGSYLDLQGRYVWALAMSKSPVLDEMKQALGDMVNLRSVMGAALWTGTTMLLLLAINPVAPGLVAVMGIGLVLYVGVDTLYNLVTGWFRLMEEVKYATTSEEIRAAGERFGKEIGRESARAFVMLAMAAIGQTAQGFAAKLPTLPGSAQVSMQAEAQAGISLPAVAVVEEIAVTAEGVRVVLPSSAVAMAANTGGTNGPCVETHHIATICNDQSTARGGPWTPRFRRLFAKAGMKLTDAANEVPIAGHKGPHPQRYHELVFNRLSEALRSCRSVEACRARLTATLDDLAKDIATPGTELNQLVTQGKPR